MLTEVYIAGRLMNQKDPHRLVWKLLGIFTHPSNAEQACETRHDFVRPLPLDETIPDLTERPTRIYFPKGKN